jgi:uncharacterized protein DUF3471
MKRIKATILIIFVGAVVASLAGESLGYPPFVAKARKFGAKDCTFCHVDPEGGPPWNERGKWLIAEKERRGADSVDPEWLVDYKPGKEAPAQPKKTPDPTPAPAPGSKKIDPKVYDDYVGEYELPGFTLVISKEGDKLFGQPTGDSKEELIPDSETEFTVSNVEAKVKFVRDDKGKVTLIVVKLEGQEMQGKKIK